MKRSCDYACHSPEHKIARRQFIGTMAAGSIAGGLGVFTSSSAAEALKSQQKRVVVFNMHGGLSQLESWDPKPGTDTGGPFRSIETSVPGVRISELMPETAKIMHHLCLVRGVNTSEDDHGKGGYMMLTGRRQSPAAEYPQIGSVMAKALADEQNPLPGHRLPWPPVFKSCRGWWETSSKHGTARDNHRCRRQLASGRAPRGRQEVPEPPPDRHHRRLHALL